MPSLVIARPQTQAIFQPPAGWTWSLHRCGRRLSRAVPYAQRAGRGVRRLRSPPPAPVLCPLTADRPVRDQDGSHL